MAVDQFIRSQRKEEDSTYSETVLAGEGFVHILEPGQVLRIVDLEGNQGIDTLFYDADNPEDHYSAVNTITAQRNLYLTSGTVLMSQTGKGLLEIVADTCGHHDTLGGSCSAQSNTVRYAHEKIYMHNCRDSFMNELYKLEDAYDYGKRDLAPNINLFTYIPVTPEGTLEFEDGISAAGCYIEFKSLCRTMVLISNCPQLNNPCNAYNPTPLKAIIWDT